MKAMDTRINVLAPLEASSLHICHYALENTEQKTTRVFHRYSGMSSNKVMVLSDVTRRWYIGRRKRRSLSQQSHKHNKFIGSLPVPINNGLIWNMAISSCSCCTRELTFSIFGTSQWHQKRVQLCCSSSSNTAYSHLMDLYMWRTKNKAARKPTIPSIKKNA